MGHDCLARLAQGTVCKILNRQALKPHKVRYYLERRDAEFKTRSAEVLCVYREVAILKSTAASQKPSQAVAIVSFDEKPGVPTIATTAPDLCARAWRLCDVRARPRVQTPGHGCSLLAGIDLLAGKVHALESKIDTAAVSSSNFSSCSMLPILQIPPSS